MSDHCASCLERERLKCWGTTDIDTIRKIQKIQQDFSMCDLPDPDPESEDESFSKDESEFWR